jgi:hypothetical protein
LGLIAQAEQGPAEAGRCAQTGRSSAGWLPLALAFLISLPAVTPRIYASDEIQYFAYLRSLWFDRDLSFENEYRAFYDRGVAATPDFHETFLGRTTETGRRLNFATIGCAILWAPFYAIAHVVARARGISADGYAWPYVASVAYASALYGFLAIVLAVRVARRVVGDGAAAAIAIALGTPLVFYMYIAPAFSHATSAFSVAAFVAVWIQVRERWDRRGVCALAALAALMGMVREQDLFVAVGPAVDFLVTAPRRHRPSQVAVSVGAAVGVFVICYLPQLLAYRSINGRFGPSRLVERKMTWTAPHALDVMFSPEHGWLAWTPLVLLALAGLGLLAAGAHRHLTASPHASAIGRYALLMTLVQVYLGGSVQSWTVAGAFGQRRFVGVTILLALGLAALIVMARSSDAEQPQRLAWRWPALVGALAIGIWWNLGLLVQFGAGMMDRQKLELRRNAATTFLVLPREAPALVYRYLFDRGSFYRPRRER